ncbi:hypothetical protein SDC9_205192 [bioreactor metagenome]|uniref:Uncharacterized protein n=1 Tax=bioreactor metagenome TaxID=1076179 RepID=A0A645J1E2_9ZZZZ
MDAVCSEEPVTVLLLAAYQMVVDTKQIRGNELVEKDLAQPGVVAC